MIAQFTIWAYGKEHHSEDIAEIGRLIKESGLHFEFHSMATNIEGEWDQVMDLIKRCRNKLLETNHRIGLNIMIDEKKGATNQIVYKRESVEEKLRK